MVKTIAILLRTRPNGYSNGKCPVHLRLWVSRSIRSTGHHATNGSFTVVGEIVVPCFLVSSGSMLLVSDGRPATGSWRCPGRPRWNRKNRDNKSARRLRDLRISDIHARPVILGSGESIGETMRGLQLQWPSRLQSKSDALVWQCLNDVSSR